LTAALPFGGVDVIGDDVAPCSREAQQQLTDDLAARSGAGSTSPEPGRFRDSPVTLNRRQRHQTTRPNPPPPKKKM
jgi:hypothetical protein